MFRLSPLRRLALSALACLAMGAATEAVAQRASALLELSIEELGEVRVVSVSRREEAVMDAPAAVFVITRADIRRSGAQSIPQALRLAPGVEVARNNAHSWTISMRGFSSDLSNKLLVLIDGRSVYTPLYAGVFWDVQNVFLEDIDRIEVIAGPAGTMWGANAVNGVINIITRPAHETEGGYFELGGGNQQRAAGLRYGTALGENGAVRGYLQHIDRDPTRTPAGDDAADDWDMTQAGFRADWERGSDRFTLQGDVYRGSHSARVRGDFMRGTLPETDIPASIDTGGGNLRARWGRALADGAALHLQLYYDRTERDIPGTLAEDRDTLHFEAQHTLRTRGRHELMWGGGLRWTSDDITGTSFATFEPASRTDTTASVFVQDRIDLWRQRLLLTLGAKFQYNDYTGFEQQPNARLSWHIDDRRMLWAAVSRAVRVPSRLESDVELLAPLPVPGVDRPFYANVRGSENFRSETLLAYELGYRMRIGTNLSFDATVFEHRYDHLLTNEGRAPVVVDEPLPYVLIPVQLDNLLEGKTYGGTLALRWQPAARWQLSAHASRLLFDLRPKPGSNANQAPNVAGNSPRNQFAVYSVAELPWNLRFYAGLRYVDELPNQGVASYTALDLSLGWRPTDRIRASVTAQNVNDARHAEFGASNEIPRSAFVKVAWDF